LLRQQESFFSPRLRRLPHDRQTRQLAIGSVTLLESVHRALRSGNGAATASMFAARWRKSRALARCSMVFRVPRSIYAWSRSARRCEWWPTRVGCPSGIMLASAPTAPHRPKIFEQNPSPDDGQGGSK
jgi:hypothetical protein